MLTSLSLSYITTQSDVLEIDPELVEELAPGAQDEGDAGVLEEVDVETGSDASADELVEIDIDPTGDASDEQ